MTKVKISKEEVIKFLKDQFKVEDIRGNKDGSFEIDVDISRLTQPVSVTPIVRSIYYPYRPFEHRPIIGGWSICTTSTKSRIPTYSASYSSQAASENE